MFNKYNRFLSAIVVASFVFISFSPCCEAAEEKHQYICNSQKLEEFVQIAVREPIIFVDTEFTSNGIICLIQITTSQSTVLIDPLSNKKIDLHLLRDLLAAEGVLKVFHACSQDKVLLRKAVGVMPTPVFDTQQAALLISPKAQLTGLAELASRLLNIEMNKDCQCSKWEQRPLSTEQLKYAADDVRTLRSLYPYLKSLLDEKNMGYQWAFERSGSIGAPKQIDKVAIQLSVTQKSLKAQLRKLLEECSEALGVAPFVLATSWEIDIFITTADEQRMAFLALPYRGKLFWKEAVSIASSVVMA